MAGIYVHIPFCKSRCIYCGFFSTTCLDKRAEYVDKVRDELSRRRDYLTDDIDTIYFGGGTPTMLSPTDLQRILQAIHYIYNVRARAEITIEGNPDDLTPQLLADLRGMGFNRLSMGIQTFSDQRLSFLKRRHTSSDAEHAVRNAQAAGFDNISVDLMFGFPQQRLGEWQLDLTKALALDVQHISAYSLMYEEGTPLCKMLELGKVSEIDEELSRQMYECLIDTLRKAGYEHYEISNFAKPGYQSRHNSSYWHGIPYLGVGAGAHSFDGHCRHYNPDSLEQYLAGAPLEEEVLSDDQLYNEYVFTALRTREGVSLVDIATKFGQERASYCMQNARPHLTGGRLSIVNERLILTSAGILVSNDVMSDLMLVGE